MKSFDIFLSFIYFDMLDINIKIYGENSFLYKLKQWRNTEG